MKNKIFNNKFAATYYFNSVSRNYVAFLIQETSAGVYMVLNQDKYDYYSKEHDIELIRMSY